MDVVYEYENGTEEPLIDTRDVAVPVAVFVSVLSVVGVIGNLCMMYAILANRHMRTAPNVLIFNLAVADLLYIVVTTPINIEHELHPASFLSTPACKVKNYVAFAAQYASAFALAALGRERHAAIVGGIEARHRGSGSCASSSRFIVVLLWGTSLLVSIPTLVFAHANERQCSYSPADLTLGRAVECVHFLVGYVVPLIIVGFYYVRIAVSLFRSTQSFQHDHVSDAMTRQARVRKRLAVSVLAIAIFFAVCWFPYFFYYLWMNFTEYDIEGIFSDVFPTTTDVYRYVGMVMPVVNTCLDPWVLFAISTRHRACLVGCLGCCCQRANTNGDQSMCMTTTRNKNTGRQRVGGAGTSFSRLSRV